MTLSDTIQIITVICTVITVIFTAITTLAGLIIATQLHKFNHHQQEEAWIKIYIDFVDSFWADPVMTKVRYWINYDQAYLEIKPVLQKRREIADGERPASELHESDFRCLDELDKFYTLALQLTALNTHLRVNFEQRFWKDLFFDHWIFGYSRGDRAELKWYVTRFYPELLTPEKPLTFGYSKKAKV